MLTKIKTLIKNDNIISLCSYGVYAFFEAAVIYILAHTYQKNDFGEWAIFYSGNILLDKLIYGIGSFSLAKFLSEPADLQEKSKLTGSSWMINLVIIIFISVISYSSLIIFKPFSSQYGLSLLLIFFPILALIRLPFNQSLAILQSRKEFKNILLLRLIGMGIFVAFCIINIIYKLNLLYVVIIYTLSYLINMIVCLFNKWSGIEYIGCCKMNVIKKLIGFGKYVMGTFIGFNILRESDILIIAFFMSKAEAALYVIPLRLIDILYVPLLGFIAVAMPKISEESSNGNIEQAKNVYYKYTGVLTLLYIPAVVILYFLSFPLIWFYGGSQYCRNEIVIAVFNILLIYGLFLPMDSLSGVTMDAINKPKHNFIKIIIMVIINIIGDLIAVIFLKSMIAVAFVTIINLLTGVIVGLLLLKKDLNIKVSKIFIAGYEFYKNSLISISRLRFLNNK